MRATRLLMGMPISVEIVDPVPASLLESVYDYFTAVDKRFSLYKPDSEISAYNRGEMPLAGLSDEMHEVLALAARTKADTKGMFEVMRPDGVLDPSGIVKGWAVRNAALILKASHVRNFYVDAGGDIQAAGHNGDGESWRVGIRNPFNDQEIVKAVSLSDCGIATSGTYVRGQHIYNPERPGSPIEDIVSLSVIGPDVLEADRFATAAFAMGCSGIQFLEDQPGLEGYVISANGIATQTSGFGAFVIS
jgi:thiamine biosynthesis lipoprotein